MSTRTVLTSPSPAASLNGPPRGQSPSLVPGGLGELPGCVNPLLSVSSDNFPYMLDRPLLLSDSWSIRAH